MSYYYKYNFVSPESIYATIKEELKSYFDTGAIDDLLFPTYVDKCLKKLGKSSYTIIPHILVVNDFEARLPDNFHAVREAWMCAEIPLRPYYSPNAFYSQAFDTQTIMISPVTVGGQTCDNPKCLNPTSCHGECMPELIQAVYKTRTQTTRSYKQAYLLKPGNISAKQNCDVNYSDAWEFYGQSPTNTLEIPFSSTPDSFDIRDNKFVTNFRNGVVHLLFYGTDYDEIGNQLIPDNYRVKEYIEAFIKYKMFELLTNQTNDETFNQLQQKMMFYKSMSDEAYIMAESEVKKQDAWTKIRRIKSNLDSFRMYELPQGNRYGRRRNN